MTKTILIADDSPSIRRVVSIALSSAGYQVYEAVDGQDALNILERKDVNLIITDDQMPDMDGIALLGEIQKISDYKDTPIIMLLSEIEDGEDCRPVVCADSCMHKPFHPMQMLALVDHLSGPHVAL
jgi:two-component system chemotaxis response regulator CheY